MASGCFNVDLAFQLCFCLLQCGGQLIGAGGFLATATNAVHSCNDIVDVHAFHQSANALQIAVATAQELHVLYLAVLNIEKDVLGASTFGLVLKLHVYISFLKLYYTTQIRANQIGQCFRTQDHLVTSFTCGYSDLLE